MIASAPFGPDLTILGERVPMAIARPGLPYALVLERSLCPGHPKPKQIQGKKFVCVHVDGEFAGLITARHGHTPEHLAEAHEQIRAHWSQPPDKFAVVRDDDLADEVREALAILRDFSRAEQHVADHQESAAQSLTFVFLHAPWRAWASLTGVPQDGDAFRAWLAEREVTISIRRAKQLLVHQDQIELASAAGIEPPAREGHSRAMQAADNTFGDGLPGSCGVEALELAQAIAEEKGVPLTARLISECADSLFNPESLEAKHERAIAENIATLRQAIMNINALDPTRAIELITEIAAEIAATHTPPTVEDVAA